MAFGTQDDTDEVMNEINMTPMVDVMLVLLIIFIITVPVMKHAVPIDLPRASSAPLVDPIKPIRLTVDAAGDFSWDQDKVSEIELKSRLKIAALQAQQPELHILGDKAVRYERVAIALSAAKEAGIRKIGFITEPK